jgi:hypothetical protein
LGIDGAGALVAAEYCAAALEGAIKQIETMQNARALAAMRLPPRIRALKLRALTRRTKMLIAGTR